MFPAQSGGVSTVHVVFCSQYSLFHHFCAAITFFNHHLYPSTVSHVHHGSPPLPVTSPHLRANLITSPLPHSLTSFFLFYFEQRINPTASPPLLSCSSPRHAALAVILFLLSLSDSDDLLAVSHVHTDSSSMFLLLSPAPLLPLFIPFRRHSSSRLSGLTWYCHLVALLHLSLIVSLTLSSSSVVTTFGQDGFFTSTLHCLILTALYIVTDIILFACKNLSRLLLRFHLPLVMSHEDTYTSNM